MSPLAFFLAAASISMASGISLPHWATHTIGQLQPVQVDGGRKEKLHIFTTLTETVIEPSFARIEFLLSDGQDKRVTGIDLDSKTELSAEI